jgi:transglutaminase-like putative cysteine protease
MEEQHDTATTHRLALLIAVVFLTVSGAVAFARVFRGQGPALTLGIAAGVAVLVAGALERRNVLLATVVSGAGLAVMIGWLIFPETTKYLLPTPTTYRAALHAWQSVGRIAAQEVAPTQPLDPLFLAALTAVWTAAFSSHVLAVRARSPLLALVPPGALLAFTSLLLDEGPRPLYVAAFLAAAMAVLFADSLRRVGHWGPLTMWHGRHRRLGPTTTLRGARRIALVCLGLAVFFPGILPGYQDEGLIDVHSKGAGQRVSINPIVDIRPALLQSPIVELFQVRSSNPAGAYWRLLSLDRFDGQRWTASNPTATGGTELKSGALSSVSPTGTAPQPNSVILQQHVVLDHLGREWLPAAYDPVQLTSNDQRVRWDPVSSTLVATDGTFKGFTYDITSQLPEPPRGQLDSVPNVVSPGLSRYTQLPGNVPQQIYQFAHQLTDDKPTMYQKVFALQQYLKTHYRYDERVPAGHDVNHIMYFLTQSKAGYCEQFAGTMAVLLRALGIPARVAVGFTPGTHDPKTGAWHVTTKNAHTWVEVFFGGQGWLAFEPTPSRFNPAAQGYATPAPPKRTGTSSNCLSRLGTDPDASCATSEPAPVRSPGLEPRVSPPRGALGPIPAPSLTTHRPQGWRWWALRAALLLAVLFVVSLPLVKLARRRLSLAMASAPRDRVLAAYRLMVDRASDLGLRRQPHETMWEYRGRLKDEVVFSDGHLYRLTRLAAVAAYSGAEVSHADADEAMDAARVAARDMVKSRGAARRVAGWFRLERVREGAR